MTREARDIYTRVTKKDREIINSDTDVCVANIFY